jgi:hypothetical protein
MRAILVDANLPDLLVDRNVPTRGDVGAASAQWLMKRGRRIAQACMISADLANFTRTDPKEISRVDVQDAVRLHQDAQDPQRKHIV